jgi:hypothetical protein
VIARQEAKVHAIQTMVAQLEKGQVIRARLYGNVYSGKLREMNQRLEAGQTTNIFTCHWKSRCYSVCAIRSASM